MIKNREISHLEHSRVRLSVTITKEAAAGEYSGLVAEYSKKVIMDGFRRGKVPAAVLERKFGTELRAETMENLIEKSLKSIFEEIEERPIMYSSPELEKDDYRLSFEEDFSFAVSYDIFPKIELGPYTGLSVAEPEIVISPEDEAHELEALVEQNSFIVEKDGEAAIGDTLTATCWEMDEAGGEVPLSRRQDFTFTLGSEDNLYAFDDSVVGMKKGEKREFTKEYPADYKFEAFAGKSKRLSFELTGLREKKRPEVNDELAQDISDEYKSLDDLTKDIRRRLEEAAAARKRQLTIEAFMGLVAEKSVIDLPESMIRAEEENLWQRFLSQVRVSEARLEEILELENSSRAALMEKWRPDAEKSLKFQLLIGELIKAEKVEASAEEVDANLSERAKSLRMDFDELKTYYTKNNMLDSVRHDIQEKKLFDELLGKNTLTKGESISYAKIVGRETKADE
ncbi:MAG: trigger factor [Spirochaetales bacterium]|nr:trigger factor [Spirochaetales bacterium]